MFDTGNIYIPKELEVFFLRYIQSTHPFIVYSEFSFEDI